MDVPFYGGSNDTIDGLLPEMLPSSQGDVLVLATRGSLKIREKD
jgi:hypothetical protein